MKRISDLALVTSLLGSERIPLVQDGVTKAATVEDLASAIGGGGITPALVTGGVVDNAPAMRAAIDLAIATGERIIRIPPGTYKLNSRVLVNAPVQILGEDGAMFGKGAVSFTTAAGIESAFTVATGAASEGGPGGEGASIRGVAISCASSVTSTPYAPSMALALNQYVRRTDLQNANVYLYRVIKAGIAAAVTEAVAFAAASDPHVPDRAKVFVPGQSVFFGTAVRSTDNTHWDRVFYAQGPGTAGSEPSWNYTAGANTVASGITWKCEVDPSTFLLGTAVLQVVSFTGIYLMCPATVEDVYIEGAQNAGLQIIGNGSTNSIGSDAQRITLRDVRVQTPAVGGVGVYVRGGEMRDLHAVNVQVRGSSATDQGAVALPTDGSQNQHGILDVGFTGASSWIGCNGRRCSGYDFWGASGSSTSVFTGCTSDLGRVRLDGSTAWNGPYPGAFWSAGGMVYGSAAPSVSTRGLHNAFETVGNITAGMYDGTTLWSMNEITDGGRNGFRYSSGRWVHSWAGLGRGAFAVTNSKVPDSVAFPNGEEPAAMAISRGFAMGADDTDTRIFPTLADYRGPLRGYYRRKGDIIFRPDLVAASAFAAEIVITAGWAGPVWTATTAKAARSALFVADVVVPTSGAVLNVFKCTTGGTTGGTEPSWASAATLGQTIADGSVVWTNVGVRAITKTIWQISA